MNKAKQNRQAKLEHLKELVYGLATGLVWVAVVTMFFIALLS